VKLGIAVMFQTLIMVLMNSRQYDHVFFLHVLHIGA